MSQELQWVDSPPQVEGVYVYSANTEYVDILRVVRDEDGVLWAHEPNSAERLTKKVGMGYWLGPIPPPPNGSTDECESLAHTAGLADRWRG